MASSPRRRLFILLPLITITLLIGLSYQGAGATSPAQEQKIYLPIVSASSGAQPPSGEPRLKNFAPATFGYSFQNFGNEDRTWQDDLTAADLFNLFGPAVCQSGTTAADCNLSGPARKWIEAQLQGMNDGHCEGMAVTSLRLWKGLAFYNGNTAPGDFQSGVANTYGLQIDQSIEQYIAYYFVTQGFSEIANPTTAIRTTKKPSEIVAILREALIDGTDPYTLGIYKNQNGQLAEGHAITPYAIEDQGNGKVRILIYDNNFPNQTKFLDVDTVNETWVYFTAASPDQDPSKYEGDANSQSLDLTRTSWRDRPAGQYFACPFCQDEASANLAQTGPVTLTLEFGMAGEGYFRVTDDNGGQVGYNPANGGLVNTIAGTTVVPAQGGLKKALAPSVRVPARSDDSLYTVEIFGEGLSAEANSEFYMAGPGYTLGLENLDIDPSEVLTATISPLGNQVTFQGSADGFTPDLYLSIDPTAANEESYVFLVDGVEIAAGQRVTVTLDFAAGRLFFDDDDGNSDSYALDVLIIYPDGREVFVNLGNLDVAAGADAALDFGSYDGDGAIDFFIDDEGDGFADDTTAVPINPVP